MSVGVFFRVRQKKLFSSRGSFYKHGREKNIKSPTPKTENHNKDTAQARQPRQVIAKVQTTFASTALQASSGQSLSPLEAALPFPLAAEYPEQCLLCA